MDGAAGGLCVYMGKSSAGLGWSDSSAVWASQEPQGT